MNTLLTIPPHTVHLWLANLPHFIADESSLLALLSPDERERAMRFHFPLHRQNFIITRGLLRTTLSLYTEITPSQIAFTYGAYGKPYLQNPADFLQFNVSHSGDLAIFALTTSHEVGVDIEKIEPPFKEKIAKRFFSASEYAELITLPEEQRIKGFYRIWSKKEAIIKTRGAGLHIPLSDFSVHVSDAKESISVVHLAESNRYYLENICVPDQYQAAFSTTHPIKHIIYKQCSAK